METLFKTKVTTIVRDKGKEMIKRVPASCVLAFTSDNLILMVEQERGNFGKIVEVPAGKVDKGEEPIEACERELVEETGYTSHDGIIFLGSYYPSVGYSTEEIHCFFAKNCHMDFEQRLDDGERIKVKKYTVEELEQKISSGEIKDSKTIICLSFFKGRFPHGI